MRRRRTAAVTHDEIVALALSDFFGVFKDEDAMRELWADQSVKEAVAQYLEERHERGHTRTCSWAEERFGK